MNESKVDYWGVVEVMGHQVYAGRIGEEVIAGHSFVRVDVPAVGSEQAFTKLFGPGSIYAITPTTEQVATLRAAATVRPTVNLYDLPRELQDRIRQADRQNRIDAALSSDDDDDDRLPGMGF